MRDEFEEEKQTTRRQTRGTLARRFWVKSIFTVAHLKIQVNGSQVCSPHATNEEETPRRGGRDGLDRPLRRVVMSPFMNNVHGPTLVRF